MEKTLEQLKDIQKEFNERLGGIYLNSKLPCCDYDLKDVKGSGPVHWNHYNKCIQCHNCGQIWVMNVF